jgi:hypothetical protein
MKIVNQTEPCGLVKNSSKFISTKCGFCGFRFGLIQFTILLFNWFRYDQSYHYTQLYNNLPQQKETRSKKPTCSKSAGPLIFNNLSCKTTLAKNEMYSSKDSLFK